MNKKTKKRKVRKAHTRYEEELDRIADELFEDYAYHLSMELEVPYREAHKLLLKESTYV